MKRLSSGKIVWYQYGMPLMYAMTGAVILVATRGEAAWVGVLMAGMIAYSIWFGQRLSEVWLDGDTLQVKGRVTFRVPLAQVLMLESTGGGRVPRVVVLGLGHPVGKIDTVRFVPAPGVVEEELQACIHAARAARKA